MEAGNNECPIFTVADDAFGWQEIVLAAQAWGEWQAFFEETRESLACLRAAAQADQLPAATDLRAAANAFRYAHNLVSAEDANGWLARWQITVEDWMNYLRGQLLRARLANQLGDIVAANPIRDESVTEVIKLHAVCADKLRDWAVRLAGRAAVVLGADAVKRPTTASPVERIAHLESAFERQRQEVVTARRIETKITDHRLEWMRFDCRYLWFAEERVAREAAWCVSEDGLTLDEIASNAHGKLGEWKFYADEIELNIRPYFLAARQGEVLGPVKIWQGFPLFSLLNKRLPAADDPQIRARAERAIIASFTEQAMNEQVRWMV